MLALHNVKHGKAPDVDDIETERCKQRILQTICTAQYVRRAIEV